MKDLIKLYKLLVSKLPEAIKTKINKSDLDRGGDGVFTARRKRSDKVIIPFKSFEKIWKLDNTLLSNLYLNGYRVLCTPKEYFSNTLSLTETPIIVRYQYYNELIEYPAPINWENVKKNRKDYLDNEIMFVQDIKNLDKFAKKGKSIYIGPKQIGQHEMDYSTEIEILKVKMCLLYQVIKCHDFEIEMSNNPHLRQYLEYCDKFEQTPLYSDNPRLQEYTTKYGYTVCPEMIEFPNKEYAKISFMDIVNGTIDGDIGREVFNRTTTKINLHHKERLMSGKLNHNHKNVFLGTACGNSIDAALRNNNFKLSDLMVF
jgi:hypothetical protein